ncbi:MAG: hypothetical protein IKH75_00990 [Ruminococcus sp.]|nr:hypothetical protein [Ruminococcus sp.]
MEIKFTNPRIVRVSYLPDCNDERYRECTWAHFDFDPDNWMLNIQSDAGDYAYRWNVEKDRKFLVFMSKIDGEYLLRKISRRTEVDIERTKERLRDCLTDMEYVDVDDAMEALDSMLDDLGCDSEDFVKYAVDEWNNEENLDICDAWDYVYVDYPNDAKKIARIFEDHIRKAIFDKLWEGGIEE